MWGCRRLYGDFDTAVEAAAFEDVAGGVMAVSNDIRN